MNEVTTQVIVGDLQRAIAFFQSLEIFEIMDLSLPGILLRAQVRLDSPGVRFVIEVCEPSSDAERSVIGRQAVPGKCLLHFSTPFFERWHQRMMEKKAAVSPMMSTIPGPFATATDPFGNTYAFHGQRPLGRLDEDLVRRSDLAPSTIVLVSGGVDSTTLLYLADRRGRAVPMFVDYGQRAARQERAAVEHHCAALGLSLRVFDMSLVGEAFRAAEKVKCMCRSRTETWSSSAWPSHTRSS